VLELVDAENPVWYIRTFSCLRCFSSFNSRYVRFDKTGVLNGFMIFLTATFCPVSRSLAELSDHQSMFI
jgi:hypothetical protein